MGDKLIILDVKTLAVTDAETVQLEDIAYVPTILIARDPQAAGAQTC